MSTRKGKKIAILGAGNVGATIAYTLTLDGLVSEIVLIDINRKKAKGEAMDILQGTPFSPPINIYAGDYPQAAGADIVIVTIGVARSPGQSRIDLAQKNVDIVSEVMPKVTKYVPDAVYIVVSNPVDILTYAIIKSSGLDQQQVVGSGTMLDSARLRSSLAEHVGLNSRNVHGVVLGEHGDTSVIPWSLASVGGMNMDEYCTHICDRHNQCGKKELREMEDDVRNSGSKIISYKGATFYAIALSVRRICECIIRDTASLLTVSGMMNGEYGLQDVCLSIPYVVGAQGIIRSIPPLLLPDEEEQLLNSANSLKEVISSLNL